MLAIRIGSRVMSLPADLLHSPGCGFGEAVNKLENIIYVFFSLSSIEKLPRAEYPLTYFVAFNSSVVAT